MSHDGRLGIPLQSLLGPRSSSGVEARTSGFLSMANMDLWFLWGVHRGVRASSHMVPCKTALLLTWKSSVSFPVWFTIVIGGFPFRGNRAVTTAIVF